MHIDASARGVLPSWLLAPILAVSGWVAIAPDILTDVGDLDRAAIGPIPAAVVFVCALADWWWWIHRGKPWHDWTVIVILLPAIGAAVWITVTQRVLSVRRQLEAGYEQLQRTTKRSPESSEPAASTSAQDR